MIIAELPLEAPQILPSLVYFFSHFIAFVCLFVLTREVFTAFKQT